MVEAPAPVDQAQPAEVSGGADVFQAAATDSYNARAVTAGEGQAPSSMETASPPVDVESGQAQGEVSDVSSENTTDQDNGQEVMTESQPIEQDTLEDESPLQVGIPEEGQTDEVPAPETVEDSRSDTSLPEADDQGSDEAESGKPPQDGTPPDVPQQDHASDSPSEEKQGEAQGSQEEKAGEKEFKPHKLKYDPEKEKDLARRQMMNPHYFLPTDFSKYFDVRTGQGPKQPLESPMARANRSIDALIAWQRKVEEQSPLSYNRKARKSRT